MPRALLLGYGNIDRQDDGVAWHILRRLATFLNYPFPETPEEETEMTGQAIELVYQPQLTPELAEMVAAFNRVCFIDAHTGNVPNDVHVEKLCSVYQPSPLTHHLTPATLLSITEALYHASPEAILVSVRGYEFEFSRMLSNRTGSLLNVAVKAILEWLSSPERAEK